jgi:hypothetical protein
MVQRVLVVHFPVTFVDLLPGEAQTAYRRHKDPALKRGCGCGCGCGCG